MQRKNIARFIIRDIKLPRSKWGQVLCGLSYIDLQYLMLTLSHDSVVLIEAEMEAESEGIVQEVCARLCLAFGQYVPIIYKFKQDESPVWVTFAEADFVAFVNQFHEDIDSGGLADVPTEPF